jgi:hypothetical protein
LPIAQHFPTAVAWASSDRGFACASTNFDSKSSLAFNQGSFTGRRTNAGGATTQVWWLFAVLSQARNNPRPATPTMCGSPSH